MGDLIWNSIPEIAKHKLASEEDREIRVNLCKSCEKLNTLSFCQICHCYMPLKTYIKTQQCPLGKW